MPGITEKRRSPRVPCGAPAVIAAYGLVTPGILRSGLGARCRDVSEDGRGLGIETAHPVFAEQRLSLERDGAACEAVVRWVRPSPGGCRAGLLLT